jgi:hypothetical protein
MFYNELLNNYKIYLISLQLTKNRLPKIFNHDLHIKSSPFNMESTKNKQSYQFFEQ